MANRTELAGSLDAPSNEGERPSRLRWIMIGLAFIATVINYPVELPFLPAYARLGAQPEDFPNAHAAQGEILSLPIFAEMTVTQQRAVVTAIADFA